MLSPGELSGITVPQLGVQSDSLQDFVGRLAGGSPRLAFEDGHRRDVVDHSLMGHQTAALDDVADAEPQLDRVDAGKIHGGVFLGRGQEVAAC